MKTQKYDILIIGLFILVLISFAGCLGTNNSSLQTNQINSTIEPIVGIWRTGNNSVFCTDVFAQDGNYSLTCSDISGVVLGKWKKTRENEYIVTQNYGKNSTWIYHPDSDSLSQAEYPSTILSRFGKDLPQRIRYMKDLSSIALTINDLPHGWITGESPNVTQTQYNSKFYYVGSSRSVGIPLYFEIKAYSSTEEAKNAYNGGKSEITRVRLDSVDIGNEGYAYQEVAFTYVIFRSANLIISFSTYAYPPIPTTDLIPLAKIVNGRING